MHFNPDMQHLCMENQERAFMGFAPSLSRTKVTYGEGTVRSWLIAQLENLNRFCGTTKKMTEEQAEECARLIMENYPYLKLTELMVFFSQVKAGRYGTFYGVVDGQKLLSMIEPFLTYRSNRIDEYERKL